MLLALSDDEIDEIGLGPIDTVLPQPASVKLLRIVMKHTNDATFFKKTISTALESGAQGGLAILHLATQNPLSFFGNIDHKLILGFSERVIGTNGLLSPRWFYAVKLLSILLDRVPPCAWRASELVPSLLSNLFRGIIEQRNPGSQGDGWDVYIRSLRLLALATQCCNAIKTDFDSTILPPTETLQPFIQCLIDLILPADDDGVRDLNAERGWAFSTLLSLLKFPGIVELIPSNKLSRLGALLMDMTLYSWTLDKDASEERILKHIISTLDSRAISALCRLPQPIINHTFSSALQAGMFEFEASNTNPYQSLALVERLLWLSNLPIIKYEVHCAMFDGGACAFLARAISYTGELDPQDRGLWRAKGLAMTCLGNIIEMMNAEQLRNLISKEMIDAVVALKENENVPLVQKGQAIFMLKRYTLAADRCGIQPLYREDVSRTADESWSFDAGDMDPEAYDE